MWKLATLHLPLLALQPSDFQMRVLALGRLCTNRRTVLMCPMRLPFTCMMQVDILRDVAKEPGRFISDVPGGWSTAQIRRCAKQHGIDLELEDDVSVGPDPW